MRVIERFLAETGLDTRFDRKEYLRFNLAGSAANYWWFDGLRHWSRKKFDQLVSVEGWEHLQNAMANGKGVILIHHHLKITHLVWVLLQRHGCTDRATIGKLLPEGSGTGKARNQPAAANSADTMMNYARQLQSAREVLGRGGVVRIVPDGFRGGSTGKEFDFFNKLRTFRGGFAELALTSGADIVPASASMDNSGRFTVSFYAPLQRTQELGWKQQSDAWIKDYVEYLNRQWRSPSLRFMSIPNMRLFLQLPSSGKGKSE